jgi:hypothetical protein
MSETKITTSQQVATFYSFLGGIHEKHNVCQSNSGLLVPFAVGLMQVALDLSRIGNLDVLKSRQCVTKTINNWREYGSGFQKVGPMQFVFGEDLFLPQKAKS